MGKFADPSGLVSRARTRNRESVKPIGMAANDVRQLVSLQFQVFGKVQGVFFRKFTAAKAEELEVRGWIRNTQRRTVEGDLEGEQKQIELMKAWLQNVGSPSSKITKAELTCQKDIAEYTFQNFSIRK